jgi:outer membrane protein assembly factor BamB
MAALYDAESGELVRVLRSQCDEDAFGEVVAASDEWIAVSARLRQSIDVFDSNGEFVRSLSGGPEVTGTFGLSLAIRGGYVAVGGDTEGVFLFDIASGNLLRTYRGLLQVARPGEGRFGTAVALSDDTLFVGDPSVGTVYAYDLAAEVLRWSTRVDFIPNLTASANLSSFGAAMALDNDSLVVAGSQYKTRIVAFVLDAGSGTIRRLLKANHSVGAAAAVAIAEQRIAAGVPEARRNGGTTYVFDRRRRIAMLKLGGRNEFNSGDAVAVAGKRVVVGAPGGEQVAVFAKR